MALFIFQFGLMQPIAALVNTQTPVAAFTLLLVAIMLLNNNFKIKSYVIVGFLLVSIFYISNYLFFEQIREVLVVGYLMFITKGFSGFLFGSLDAKNNKIYKAFLSTAIINALLLSLYPFTSFMHNVMNYMRFGYAIIPSALMFWIAFICNKNYKKIIWFIVALFYSLLSIIYGPRGTIIVLILFFVLLFIFNQQLALNKKVLISIAGSMVIFLVIKMNILIQIIDFIQYNLGIRTYTISKIRMALNHGIIESSSGRDLIYESIWNHFLENPIFGNGVMYVQAMSGGGTAHNLILQILVETGILGLLIWLIIAFYLLYKYRNISKLSLDGLFGITTMVLSISVGRLLVSSDMWLRPEFWFVISLLINCKMNKIKSLKGCNLQ